MKHRNRKLASAAAGLCGLFALALSPAAQAATKPLLTVEPASSVTAFGAHLSGTVDPGEAESSCRFAVVTDARFQKSEFTEADHSACDVNPVEGTGAQAVGADVTLRPNTLYHFALEASNEAGAASLEGETFTTQTAPPAVETGPNTPFPGGKVHLLGYVDPEEMAITSCEFEYGPEAGNYENQVPCANHPGNEIQAVNLGAVGGKVRLGFEGETTEDLPFNASASEVQSALRALPAIGPTGVSVELAVSLSDFRRYVVTFEGPLADENVGAIEREEASEQLQVGPQQSLVYALVVETLDEGGGSGPREVVADLTGLAPGATFHYRIVAGNGAGQAQSDDGIFRVAAEEPGSGCSNEGALGTSFLGECRAYEMVSPPAKNGGDVIAASQGTRIAADGSAAAFMSASLFGDVQGSGIAAEYESVRTPEGWRTHGIFPKQPPGSFQEAFESMAPRYVGEFSPDLNRGVFWTPSPIDSSNPYVDEAVNLYLRRDLLEAGAGNYGLLSDCPLCAEKEKALPLGFSLTYQPSMVGASIDLKHVVFESPFNLAKPANSTGRKLYESEEGTVRLVGILPNGTAAAESTAIGLHSINENTVNEPHTVSADGSKIVFTSGTNLYLRVNHERTVQLNESELSMPEGNGSANFVDATPDGSRVLFFDTVRLTEGAAGGLYMYDTTKPATDPHNLTFIGQATKVTGMDASGDIVYFKRADDAGFEWHEGQLRKLGTIRGAASGTSGAGWDQRVTPQGQLLFDGWSLPHGLQPQFPGYCPEYEGKPLCVQFYTYDSATEALQCVSCRGDGEPMRQAHPEIEGRLGMLTVPFRFNHPIAADGKHVFFSTDVALVPEDTNGVFDVYTFNTATSHVSLISRGTDGYPSYFMEASPSGSDALFTTRQRLSGWDGDTNADLYDARVGGGLSEPTPTPASCEGEACFEPPTLPPNRGASGSETFSGLGNPKPERHKKRHKKRHRKHRHHKKQGGHR